MLLASCLTVFEAISQNSRPQEPLEPFSYQTEELSFKNKKDSVMLAGTLTYPMEGSKFPAVVLLSGSGPQNRNSEYLDHKPFLVIADYLTKNGVAVLRFDDRGTGLSEGNHNQTSLEGLVNDAESAFEYLKSRPEIDRSKVGLIGHSLGGLIATIIASDNKGVSFVILLASPGMRGDKLMLLQKEQMERKMGVSESVIAVGQQNMRGAYDLVLKSGQDLAQLEQELFEYYNGLFGQRVSEEVLKSLSKKLSIPWTVDFIKLEPKEYLQKLRCPVLALNGSKDMQVPAEENLAAIAENLEGLNMANQEVGELKGLNHLFQECKTGLPDEYAKIEQTISPIVLNFMLGWIRALSN